MVGWEKGWMDGWMDGDICYGLVDGMDGWAFDFSIRLMNDDRWSWRHDYGYHISDVTL